MRVREAVIEDAPGIARVHVRTWQHAYRGIVPDDYLDALDVERRAEQWRDLGFVDTSVHVAEAEGSIVGFISVAGSRDETGVGEVFAIYVDREFWGTGAGGALLEAGQAVLRTNHREATLWVLKRNGRARRFYEKHGWSFDGTTKEDDRGTFVLQEVRYRTDL